MHGFLVCVCVWPPYGSSRIPVAYALRRTGGSGLRAPRSSSRPAAARVQVYIHVHACVAYASCGCGACSSPLVEGRSSEAIGTTAMGSLCRGHQGHTWWWQRDPSRWHDGLCAMGRSRDRAAEEYDQEVKLIPWKRVRERQLTYFIDVLLRFKVANSSRTWESTSVVARDRRLKTRAVRWSQRVQQTRTMIESRALLPRLTNRFSIA
jgi:hypothetical protein